MWQFDCGVIHHSPNAALSPVRTGKRIKHENTALWLTHKIWCHYF
uniref:Uncharacterized protein n=1 Tax=Anguilla anguilla TaxID=7936 RepID=A0A0E9U6J2_ANGAN